MRNRRTWMLKMKAVINGRLVMVETRQKAYYQYRIFPDENERYYNFNAQGKMVGDNNIVNSGFKYTSAFSAFLAGKKYAKGLPAITPNS